MDPDDIILEPPPSVFNYILSFLLVGVAWGFTTPFIRRAAADFNARQEAQQQGQPRPEGEENEQYQAEEMQLQTHRRESQGNDKDGDKDEPEIVANENEDEDEDEDADQPPSSAKSPTPAWMKSTNASRSSWLKQKITTLFWTVFNLLRTPAYSIPLVVNLTGSIWFFLLVGQHELSLTVPLANSSAFLFTVVGEWYVERKIIAKETWLGLALVLGGIALCVQSKGA